MGAKATAAAVKHSIGKRAGKGIRKASEACVPVENLLYQ